MDGIAHRTIAGSGIILRRYVCVTATYFVSIVLLVAGALKIYDPAPLLGTLELLSFINNSFAILIATILPVIEIAIGILLLTGTKAKIAVVSAAGLFWFFFSFSVYGYAAGLYADCGCFGDVIASDFGVGMILRNALFAAVASMLLLNHRKNK